MMAGRIADRHGSGCRVKNTLIEGDCDCTARDGWAKNAAELAAANVEIAELRNTIRAAITSLNGGAGIHALALLREALD